MINMCGGNSIKVVKSLTKIETSQELKQVYLILCLRQPEDPHWNPSLE